MDLQLGSKRALVTGSSSGLGEEIARVLAAEGASVVVHGRDEGRTTLVAKSIREAGGEANIVIGDLSTDAGADHVASGALEYGPIDILVNNAGIYEPTAVWEHTSSADWADIYNVDVISSVRMVLRIVPGMRERGWGRVIQISSTTADMPAASQPHYAAGSAARKNLATSLSRELKNTGVTSNAVVAGGVLSPAIEERLTQLGQQKGWGETWEQIEPNLAKNVARTDVPRIGRPRDYGNLVTYLASPLSDYITGAALRIDGGQYNT